MAKIRAFYLCVLFYLFIAIGMVAIVPPWFLYCAIFRKQQKFILACKPFFAFVFFLLGIKVKMIGDLPEHSKACFMLCNHQSFMDVPVILLKIFPCAFLAKKSLFKIPYFGQALTYTGSLPVVRGDRQANIDLPKKIQNRLSQNFPIMAFPEGTRSGNGKLLPFKNGIFHIIKDAGVPVFPVTIMDAHKVLPKSGFSLYPGEIKVFPHKIITAQEIENLTYEELKNLVTQRISEPIVKHLHLAP
ncbi:MAG: 1-acyl-sn-glycerol-3-phosphate acyltransferase [Fibromonadales bacterium]|nr:1-acyl-sn-glycerol-3-phosphate acyltransferase [Fibromonadales bacterium]